MLSSQASLLRHGITNKALRNSTHNVFAVKIGDLFRSLQLEKTNKQKNVCTTVLPDQVCRERDFKHV